MGSTGYAEKTIIFRGASMKNLKKKVHFRIKLKVNIFWSLCRSSASAVLLPLFHPA